MSLILLEALSALWDWRGRIEGDNALVVHRLLRRRVLRVAGLQGPHPAHNAHRKGIRTSRARGRLASEVRASREAARLACLLLSGGGRRPRSFELCSLCFTHGACPLLAPIDGRNRRWRVLGRACRRICDCRVHLLKLGRSHESLFGGAADGWVRSGFCRGYYDVAPLMALAVASFGAGQVMLVHCVALDKIGARAHAKVARGPRHCCEALCRLLVWRLRWRRRLWGAGSSNDGNRVASRERRLLVGWIVGHVVPRLRLRAAMCCVRARQAFEAMPPSVVDPHLALIGATELPIEVLILETVIDFPAEATRRVEAPRHSCGSPGYAFGNMHGVASFALAGAAASIMPELPLLPFEARLSVRRLPQELPSYGLLALWQPRRLQARHRVQERICYLRYRTRVAWYLAK